MERMKHISMNALAKQYGTVDGYPLHYKVAVLVQSMDTH